MVVLEKFGPPANQPVVALSVRQSSGREDLEAAVATRLLSAGVALVVAMASAMRWRRRSSWPR